MTQPQPQESPVAGSLQILARVAAHLVTGCAIADVGVCFDPAISGRAEAAYLAEYARWQGMIEPVALDRTQSFYHRAQALAALRQRQEIAAQAMRQCWCGRPLIPTG